MHFSTFLLCRGQGLTRYRSRYRYRRYWVLSISISMAIFFYSISIFFTFNENLIMSTTIPISKCKQCFHFEPFLFMHFWRTFEKGPSKRVNNWKLKKILDVRKFTIFWDGRVNKINIDLDIDIDDSGHYQYRYRIDLKIRLSLTPAVRLTVCRPVFLTSC